MTPKDQASIWGGEETSKHAETFSLIQPFTSHSQDALLLPAPHQERTGAGAELLGSKPLSMSHPKVGAR